MADPKEGGTSIGIWPYEGAAQEIAKGTMEGAGAFLGRICLPAAEEFGLLLRDKVSQWRAKNAASIAANAERLLETQGGVGRKHAHPRIVGKILEGGSWEDDPQVQTMWSGLLASACTRNGQDQRNLVFVNLLEQMTSSQAKLLSHACEIGGKFKTKEGLIQARDVTVSNVEAMELLGAADLDDADVQLDHMREIGVLNSQGGFQPFGNVAHIAPSALGLHLYVRCKGFEGSPIEYFDVTENEFPSSDSNKETSSDRPVPTVDTSGDRPAEQGAN